MIYTNVKRPARGTQRSMRHHRAPNIARTQGTDTSPRSLHETAQRPTPRWATTGQCTTAQRCKAVAQRQHRPAAVTPRALRLSHATTPLATTGDKDKQHKKGTQEAFNLPHAQTSPFTGTSGVKLTTRGRALLVQRAHNNRPPLPWQPTQSANTSTAGRRNTHKTHTHTSGSYPQRSDEQQTASRAHAQTSHACPL